MARCIFGEPGRTGSQWIFKIQSAQICAAPGATMNRGHQTEGSLCTATPPVFREEFRLPWSGGTSHCSGNILSLFPPSDVADCTHLFHLPRFLFPLSCGVYLFPWVTRWRTLDPQTPPPLPFPSCSALDSICSPARQANTCGWSRAGFKEK